MNVPRSRFTLMLLGLIAVAIVVLAIGIGLWQHQVGIINALRRDAREKEKLCRTITEQLSQRQSEEEKLQDLKQRLEVLDQNLADYRYVPTYLRQMQATALRTGNNIRSIQPGELKPLNLQNSPFATEQAKDAAKPAATEPAPAKDQPAPGLQYQSKSINLDVQGTYVTIVKLLDEFRQFPKMIYVKSVELTPQSVNGKNLVSARIQTYAIITPDQYETDNTPLKDATGGAQ